MSTLPLTGGRKKPAPRPRTEGVMKPRSRKHFCARIYPSGAKRALYISTGQSDVLRAQELLPHIRAQVARGKRVALPQPHNPRQPELFAPPETGAAAEPPLT